MRDGHKSNSRFWGPLHRLFHRRSSGRRRETNTTIPTESDISDITDGFYLYSQSLINEEAEKLEALKAQSSESTGMSYASAVSTDLSPLLPHLHYMLAILTSR